MSSANSSNNPTQSVNPTATAAVAQAPSESKYLSIIPENAQNYRAGQKIIFNLEPELGFVKAKDSYLVFDVLNNSGRGTTAAAAQRNLRLELGLAGVSSLIKRVNIYSKHTGQLLESLDNYNQWTHTQLQYEHDDKTNLQTMEGCPKHMESKCAFGRMGTGGGAGAAETRQNLSINNNKNTYLDAENNRLSPCLNNGTPTYTSTRFITPLRCGLFRHWDDERLVPVLMLGGLRIEIELAPVGEALTLHYSGVRKIGTLAQARGLLSENGHLNSVAPGMLGAQIGVSAVVGDGNSVGGATQRVFTIAANNRVNTDSLMVAYGLAVGNRITLTALAGPTNFTGNIVSMAVTNNLLNITVDADLGAATQATTMLSLAPGLDNTAVDYLITNTEFRLLRVTVPQSPPKNMSYEFTTYDLFKDTIPATQLNFNQEITSVASRALGIFSLFEDPRQTGSQALARLGQNSYYAGVSAGEQGVNMNEVVYFINNKLYPLNAYNVNPTGDKVITLNELVKAWASIGVRCKSRGCGEFADLDVYTNRFMVARELARDGSVFNLQNAEPQLRLTFSAARANDLVNQSSYNNINMLTYVFSKQVIQITDKGLEITK